jgi:putative transposase
MDNPLPQRKNPRLKDYDYTQCGMYFVTICTHKRAHRFGYIENQEMHLNETGEIAAASWSEIPAHYPQVELDVFVVMPNHVHGIIVITDMVESPDTTDGIYAVPTVAETGKKRVTLGTIIGTYKAAVTRAVNSQSSQSKILWQERYHDHIIRNEAALNHIRQYVHHNPALWEKDTFYD